MSKSYLWSIDDNRCISSLSSWNNSWHHIDSSISKINKFDVVSAASWCIWAIGADKELYLYIPDSDIVIRTAEVIIENQRMSSGIFSDKNLKHLDPPEFTTPNYYGKLLKTDLKTFKLPSNRWKWETDWKIRSHFNGELTNEGWTYSSNFQRRFQVERSFLLSSVRRRFWQRYRCFHTFDRWIHIAQDAQPFEISCGHDCCNNPTPAEESIEIGLPGIFDVACGGEMLPHQKDGFLSVWIVNSKGQVLCRLNVHRQNPEGSHWCLVKLPQVTKAISVSVGPLGSLLICSDFGDIYFRENITWKNPLGTSWKKIRPPSDLWDKEQIVQLTVSNYSIWARSILGRVWLRSKVNLHETRTKICIGDSWNLVTTDVQYINVAVSGQLLALPTSGDYILYKSLKSKNLAGKHFWTGKLPMNFNKSIDCDFVRMVSISCSGLFLEDDVLPTNWIPSPITSHKKYDKNINSEYDWKIKILQSLKIRDMSEYKNPKFSNFISSFEQTFWSKASECQIQCFSSDFDRNLWLSASVILHHKVKNNINNATIHVSVKSVDLCTLEGLLFFMESNEVICVSKYQLDYSMLKMSSSLSCATMLIFVKNKMLSPSPNKHTNVSRVMLKFSSETDVEDWIMAINFVSVSQKICYPNLYPGMVWFLNQFHEPFSSSLKSCDDSMHKWHQDGGHFCAIESGAQGLITWALGYNGIAWTHSKGWGGSYLGNMCSSKDHLSNTYDSQAVFITEYQRFKCLPGNLSGAFSHYMWIDDRGHLLRDQNSVQLPSRRWLWDGEWSIVRDKDVGKCDSEGWQYSTGRTHKFNDTISWHTNLRRRTWTRIYKTSVMGPWKEIRNHSIKLIAISIFPGTEYSDDKNHLILAVTDKYNLLVRKGVTLQSPGGHLWLHMKTTVKIKSITVNKNGIVWIVSLDGFIRRLKMTNFRDITKINENDWEILKHADRDGQFESVSSGDHHSVWAVDSDNNLWVRQFDMGVQYDSMGTTWIYVCDSVTQVSCASLTSVWVLFSDGCVAERIGISQFLPQGDGWTIKLNGVATYLSICGA